MIKGIFYFAFISFKHEIPLKKMIQDSYNETAFLFFPSHALPVPRT